MKRQCLFCDAPANSREHLWAVWILERVRTRDLIRHSIGNSPLKLINNPQLKVRSVCSSCNQGWMSALESRNIPIIGSLLQDIATPLDASQKLSIALWATKTAMVVESISAGARKPFYTREEHWQLREDSAIPERSTVWVGRFAGNALAATGTDFWIDQSPEVRRIARGCSTTIIIGHLAVQVVTIHTRAGYENHKVSPKEGRWHDLLLRVWPPEAHDVHWPPHLSFNNGEPQAVARLMDRWRIGRRAN